MLVITALLDQEVRDRRGNLQTGGQRARALEFGNAAGITNIRLQNHRGPLLQNLPKARLGEDAFARVTDAFL